MQRRWAFKTLASIAAVASFVLLVAVICLCIRAQFGSNDYLEWNSKDAPVPEGPDSSVPLDDPKWAAFTAQFEQWDRARWQFHIRANRDAIYVFGRQPFY